MATKLTYAQLESVWEQGGGSPSLAPLMAAIALAESSGDPDSTNPTDNDGTQTSWGLWQISTGTHAEPAPNWNDPVENARLAVAKYKEQGLGAWGTYDSGAYKQYLQGNVPAGTYTDTGGAGTAAASTGAGFSLSWLDPFGVTSDVATVIADVMGPISNTLQDFWRGFNVMMRAVVWLVQPSNWLRIIAGVGGVLLLPAAVFFLATAA